MSGGILPAEASRKIVLGDELLSMNGQTLEGLEFPAVIGKMQEISMNVPAGSALRLQFRPSARKRQIYAGNEEESVGSPPSPGQVIPKQYPRPPTLPPLRAPMPVAPPPPVAATPQVTAPPSVISADPWNTAERGVPNTGQSTGENVGFDIDHSSVPPPVSEPEIATPSVSAWDGLDSMDETEEDSDDDPLDPTTVFHVMVSPDPDFGVGLRLVASEDGTSAFVESFKKNPGEFGRCALIMFFGYMSHCLTHVCIACPRCRRYWWKLTCRTKRNDSTW